MKNNYKMILIKKKIKNGYINFVDEVKNNTKVRIREAYGKTSSWGATISVYDTLKYIERAYFKFLNYEMDVENVRKGNVLNIRNEVKICDVYSFVCDEFYLITSITSNEIILENMRQLQKR
ncbi:hypothetical protein L1S34_04235 [Flavobacterium sp. K77]|uniref:hypothetical protein n=1 Tax=Flavobacterium sp. K77 TaxID=2910676 RepID=UPI001F307A22|nr:hypothetical protein [Flavobacterium sp. K77]MCF6140486.1 hypothetical protein [Flavobacterium sp. K77]